MDERYVGNKPLGWFSRRNQTSEAYEAYMRAKDDKVWHLYYIIEENKKAREARNPQQQLALLDERLGVGVGARKERMKLVKLIAKKENK